MKIKNYRFLLVSVSLFAISSIGHASGFRVPEISTAGTATSNAIVANGDIAGALPYNPAIMTFQPDNTLVTGLTQLEFDLSVTPSGSSTKVSNTGKDSFTIPNFFYKSNINNDVAWGLAINAPFGLQTKWPENTFSRFLGVDAVETEFSEIKMININPNMSFRIDENSSFAFGIDYYDVLGIHLDTYGNKIGGTGQHHGYNLAFYQKAGKLSFGMSYHSPVAVQINGLLNTTPISAVLTFPSTFQFGVRYKATDRFALEFDYDRTGWSSYGVINIIRDSDGVTVTTSTNNWENVNAYRLSAIYDLSSNTQLRFGFAKDETPQTANANFSARSPDADRNLYSIGIAHKVSGWTIEAAYMYVDQETRTVSGSPAYVLGGEPNGTDVYDGTYETKVQLFSIGIVKSF